MNITAKTKVVGVFGHPVGHSLSPQMHNAAFAHLSLDFVYIAMDVHPNRLAEALKGIAALNFIGINVTIPHKEQTAELVDEITDEARLMGAVNTVINRNGYLLGDNTDGRGFMRPLLAEGFNPHGKQALLLGAGGAARGVAIALVREGTRVVIANRTEERAEELAEMICRIYGPDTAVPFGFESDALGKILWETDLLVNSTSIGMLGNPRKLLPIQEESLHPKLFVYDLVYNPLETPLLAVARKQGCRILSGVKMLVHQGALAFEAWTGAEAPVEVMESAVVSHLNGSSD